MVTVVFRTSLFRGHARPAMIQGVSVMAKSPKPSEPGPSAEPPETSSNTIEMILNQEMPATQGGAQKPVTETIRALSPEPAPARMAMPFRPTARPKVAMLTVCDDGKTDGEVIRIRSHRFIIGRTEGDLCIPIDGRISARHVEITLQTIGAVHHRWVVTDLQSTHGLFVRVSRTAPGRAGRVPGRQRALPVRRPPVRRRGDDRPWRQRAGLRADSWLGRCH